MVDASTATKPPKGDDSPVCLYNLVRLATITMIHYLSCVWCAPGTTWLGRSLQGFFGTPDPKPVVAAAPVTEAPAIRQDTLRPQATYAETHSKELIDAVNRWVAHLPEDSEPRRILQRDMCDPGNKPYVCIKGDHEAGPFQVRLDSLSFNALSFLSIFFLLFPILFSSKPDADNFLFYFSFFFFFFFF